MTAEGRMAVATAVFATITLGLIAIDVSTPESTDEPRDWRGPYLIGTNPDVWGPMPCRETEVFVWDDYPVTAECLDQDDHVGHARNEEEAITQRTTQDREPEDPTWAANIQAMVDAENKEFEERIAENPMSVIIDYCVTLHQDYENSRDCVDEIVNRDTERGDN